VFTTISDAVSTTVATSEAATPVPLTSLMMIGCLPVVGLLVVVVIVVMVTKMLVKRHRRHAG